MSNNNPLENKIGLIVFCLLVFCGVIVALLLCSDALELSNATKLTTVKIFSILISVGWFSFSIANTAGNFLSAYVLSSLISGPLIAMVLTNSPTFFWISFVSVALVLFIAPTYKKGGNELGNFMTSMYCVWVVVGIFVTIGETSYFTYAKSVKKLSEIHFIFDIRYFISAFLGITCAAKALRNAYRVGHPVIVSLPEIKLPDISNETKSIITPLLQPFIIIINIILFAVLQCANILWQQIASFFVYLYRISVNLANDLWNMFTIRSVLIKCA